MIGPWYLITHAEQKISSGLAGLLVATVPIWAAIFASLNGDHTVWHKSRVFGLAIGFIGVVAVVGIESISGRQDLKSIGMVILAAIGYAGIKDLDVNHVQMWLGDVWVAKDGGRNPSYQEADGQRVMQAPEITVKIDLGRGSAAQTMWTCDLSHDYVSINADYRS